MKICNGVKLFSFKISGEEIRQKIKHIKETKGSSPSGRRIGHYKIALYNGRIMSAHADMIITTVKHNLTPRRWT